MVRVPWQEMELTLVRTIPTVTTLPRALPPERVAPKTGNTGVNSSERISFSHSKRVVCIGKVGIDRILSFTVNSFYFHPARGVHASADYCDFLPCAIWSPLLPKQKLFHFLKALILLIQEVKSRDSNSVDHLRMARPRPPPGVVNHARSHILPGRRGIGPGAV